LSQAHDTKIRTLAYVEYATVAGGSAASIEGALPLTAIGEANSAYPLLFLRFGGTGRIISFFFAKTLKNVDFFSFCLKRLLYFIEVFYLAYENEKRNYYTCVCPYCVGDLRGRGKNFRHQIGVYQSARRIFAARLVALD